MAPEPNPLMTTPPSAVTPQPADPAAAVAPTAGATAATHRAIDSVWRAESARIVAHVARLVRDIGRAEELAQDALVAALEHWPVDGLPERPGAWLMTTAKRRALDALRQSALHARKEGEYGQDLATLGADHQPDFVDLLAEASEDDIGCDLLRLIFTACHPLLTTEAQVALTLRLLCGLSTADIARAFLVPEPTLAQRIVRAKRTLSQAQVPFEVPGPAERPARLASVLAVIYLVFNEGHAATAGEDWLRPALCSEALRLGQVLAGLMPAEPEVHGLLALMAIQASRLPARVDAQGRPVLLMDQDRKLWDAGLIDQGLKALAASEAAAQAAGVGPGLYALQAGMAACHARAARAEDTDWPAILAAYDRLLALAPSPVVALNRAVALCRVQGPAAALPVVQALLESAALADYPWLYSVQGDVLAQLGQAEAASAAFEKAAALTRNERERELLLARARGG